MDAVSLANLKTEINALPTFISTYDTGVANFLNGTSNTCPHFLDSIGSLSLNNSLSTAFAGAWSGQGISYGVLTDLVYTISAIQRNASILSMNKAMYYAENDTTIAVDAQFNLGEAAKILSYLQGKSPNQGVIV